MSKDSDFAAGIILGILGLAVLSKIFSKKCSFCGASVSTAMKNCPKCGSDLIG